MNWILLILNVIGLVGIVFGIVGFLQLLKFEATPTSDQVYKWEED